jgi:hypothetical protein
VLDDEEPKVLQEAEVTMVPQDQSENEDSQENKELPVKWVPQETQDEKESLEPLD